MFLANVGAVVALLASGDEVGAVALLEDGTSVVFVVNPVTVEFSYIGACVSGLVPLFTVVVEGGDVATGTTLGACVEGDSDG